MQKNTECGAGARFPGPGREPGTGWSYSNTNYVLARLLIEKVTGSIYADQMHRLIVGPLGLTGTIAPTTQPTFPTRTPTPTTATNRTASRRSSMSPAQPVLDPQRRRHDLDQPESAHLHLRTGDRQAGAGTLLAEMFTPHDTGIPQMGYGLGIFARETADGTTVITHNGGHGGHGALMFSTPDGRTTLTATLNYIDDAELSLAGAFQTLQQRVIDVVFGSEKA